MKKTIYLSILATLLLSCTNESKVSNQEITTKIESKQTILKNEVEKNKSVDLINEQLIIVLAEKPSDTKGFLMKYEFLNNQWEKVDQTIDVTLGKSGITKGRGIEINHEASGLYKVEGDGKSPSGCFTIGDAFGFAPISNANGLKLNYYPIDSFTRCIEDDQSKYYNQIVQLDAVDKDWEFADKMRNVSLYEWGFFVNHNTHAMEHAGSCIFFHIWPGPGKYTLGCTAMSKENILDLLHWIDPNSNPLVIQYLISDYLLLRKKMNLPEINFEDQF